MLRVALALALMALAPVRASADVIQRLECPPGLDVRGAHERDCWPRACTSDAQCGAGAQCRQVSRCIQTRGIHEGDTPEPTPRDFDVGPCGEGGACPSEASCRSFSRCEPTEATPAFANGRWTRQPHERPAIPPPSGGCAAAAPPAGPGGLTPLALGLSCARAGRRSRRRTS